MSASDRDRLYNLIPAIYRIRDSEIGEPLHALLGVVENELSVVERDIERLYENWFIETCEEWAIPYIGDLVGHDPVLPSNGEVTDPHVQKRNRWLFPRREIANIVRYRRRKGTVPVLEDLSRDIAGWPALARETRCEVAGMVDARAWAATTPAPGQSIVRSVPPGSLPIGRRLPDRRQFTSASQGGALSNVPRLPDLREPGPGGRGLPHPRRVGLWVWQLPVYPFTGTAPGCRVYRSEGVKLRYFTFHPLGIDTPLYNPVTPSSSAISDDDMPPPVDDPLARASELPVPLLRGLLSPRSDTGISHRFYGPGKAFQIRLDGEARRVADAKKPPADEPDFRLVPPERIRVADLSDSAMKKKSGTPDQIWQSLVGEGTEVKAIVDPETGRFLIRNLVHPPECGSEPGIENIRLTFHYAFSGDLGGGEYRRPVDPLRRAATWSVSPSGSPVRVSSTCPPLRSFTKEELAQSSLDRAVKILTERLAELERLGTRATKEQRQVVLELAETGVYRLSKGVSIRVPADVFLEIRAGRETRPVIQCVTQDECDPRPLWFVLNEGSQVVLDGVTIATSGICVTQAPRTPIADTAKPGVCGSGLDPRIPDPSRFTLRHTSIASSECCTCAAGRIDSLLSTLGELVLGREISELCIDHSILGAIRGSSAPFAGDRSCVRSPVRLTILDSIVAGAIGSGRPDFKLTGLRVERSTLLLGFAVQQIDRISNSLVLGEPRVDRATGLVRYSYYEEREGVPAPTLEQCLPQTKTSLAEGDFVSLKYGAPGFARLRRPRPGEEQSLVAKARTGADDGGEMGAFHDQFVPHRERSLERRLEEFTPATHKLVIEYISGAPP